jgi:hypothetical protein
LGDEHETRTTNTIKSEYEKRNTNCREVREEADLDEQRFEKAGVGRPPWTCLSPGIHCHRGIPDHKDPFVVQVLSGRKNEKPLSIR